MINNRNVSVDHLHKESFGTPSLFVIFSTILFSSSSHSCSFPLSTQPWTSHCNCLQCTITIRIILLNTTFIPLLLSHENGGSRTQVLSTAWALPISQTLLMDTVDTKKDRNPSRNWKSLQETIWSIYCRVMLAVLAQRKAQGHGRPKWFRNHQEQR